MVEDKLNAQDLIKYDIDYIQSQKYALRKKKQEYDIQ